MTNNKQSPDGKSENVSKSEEKTHDSAVKVAIITGIIAIVTTIITSGTAIIQKWLERSPVPTSQTSPTSMGSPSPSPIMSSTTPIAPSPTPTSAFTPTPTPTPVPSTNPPTPVYTKRLNNLVPDDHGVLRANETMTYVVAVQQNEILEAVVSGEGVLMTLFGPDNKPIADSARRVAFWQGRLPYTGDYFIVLKPVQGIDQGSFRIDVTLK